MRSTQPTRRVAVLAIGLILLAWPGHSRAERREREYRLVDLGGLGGADSSGLAINRAGQVLGSSASGSYGLDFGSPRHFFLADPDGTLHPLPSGATFAVAVNGAGQVAGDMGRTHPCGADLSQAFRWSPGGGTQLLPPLSGDLASNALGINDRGMVAGVSRDGWGEQRAVVWEAGQPLAVDLGAPAGSSAFAVNNWAQVLGYLNVGKKGEGYHFLLWTAAAGVQELPSLTRPGDWYSLATGLGDNGSVIGTSTDNGPDHRDHAVLWDPATGPTDLGMLPGDSWSRPLAVNASGLVLGVSYDAADNQHFFLWDRVGGIRPVQLPIAFTALAGLNDRGDLVGTTSDAAGAPRAFSYREGHVNRLGTIDGGWSAGAAINEHGEVTGRAIDRSGGVHAFQWSRERGMLDLGDASGGHGISSGAGIDGRGRVAGSAALSPAYGERAFVWDPESGLVDIGSLAFGPGRGFSQANGMNHAGLVVGISDQFLPDGYLGIVPYLWDRRTGMRALTVAPEFLGPIAFTPATAINDRGTVVGWGWAPGLGSRAWRWDATAGMSDIGALDGGEAAANAVNDHDQIVGSATTGLTFCGYLTSHAFLSTPAGGMQDLGALPGDAYSYAAAINNHGDVVGNSGAGPLRAFLYRNARMFDLTELAADPDWVLELATGINDAGQITGIGFHHGLRRAFLFERRPEESKPPTEK